MKRLILLLIVGILAVPGVAAEEITTITGFQVEGHCVNATHLNKTIPLYIDGDLITLETGPTFCPYGCTYNATQYGDDCVDQDPYKAGLSGFFLLAVSALFIALAKMAKKPLDLMFSFVSLFSLIGAVLTASFMTVIHYPAIYGTFVTVYTVAIFTTFPIVAWFFFGTLLEFYASTKKAKVKNR